MGIEFEIKDNSELVNQALQEQIEKALLAIGLVAEGDVKEEIREPKPHKTGTPLDRGNIDTGAYRDSISHAEVPEEKEVYVGTNIEYAQYLEFGAKDMPAYHNIKHGIESNIDKYKEITEKALKGEL